MIHNSLALGWFRKHLRIPTTGLLLITFSLWSVQVKGATFAWDGGDGNWDVNTTANWNTGGFWTNSLNNIAVFGGTAGTVTLADPITAGGLTFNASDYTIAAGTLTLSAPTGSTSPVIAVNGIDSRATIGSILAGSNGFTKTGAGSLLLTNSSNSFGGDIAVKDGVLIITNAAQLGSGTTAISVTGIAQSGSPGFSGGTLSLAGSATAGGTGLTLNREVSVSGRGPNAVNNTGGLVSVGYNTLAGGLTLGSAATDSRVWATHGTTTISGGVNIAAGTSNSAIFQGNGNWTISGVVTGSENAADRFIKIGQLITTTLWLKNAGNNFTNVVRIDSGTVRVQTNAALGLNAGTGSVDLNNGTFEVRTDAASGFAGRTVRIRNNTTGTIFFDHDLSGGLGIGSAAQNQTLTMGALIRDAGANAGNITLNGRNGYNISFTSFLPAAGDYRGVTITNNSSGVATFNGDVWNMNNAASSAFTVAGNAETVITGNVLATGGNHLLTKTGTGTFTYGGTAGTYTGSTTVTGTVVVTSIGAFNSAGAGAIQMNSGALDYRGTGETSTKLLNLSGTTGNGIVLANQPSGSALIFNGSPVGAGGIGAKTLFLGGSSDGSIINEIGGVINDSTSATSLAKVGGNTWLYDPAAATYSAAVSVNSGAASGTGTNVFTVASSAGIIVGQAVTGTNVPAGSVVTGIDGNTITISNNIGTTAIASATALTFRASSNFTGNVTVGGGTLQVRPTASSGNGSDVINNGSQIIFGADALTNNGWAGGIFEYQGSLTGGTLTEQVGALTATAGAGAVKVTANGGLPTLNFASLGSRTAGATLNLNPGANSDITFTAAAGTNGILGGYATFGADGTDFAASVTAGGTAAALTGQSALPASGATSTVNYQSSADTTTAAQSINSLKMSGAQTITLGGVLTVTSGGILFDNSTGSAMIQNNGTATNTLGAAAELIVTTNGSAPANALTINARIGSGAASLTKAGSGTLIVGGDNTYTGSTTVNAGILTMAAGSTSASLGAPAAGSVFTLRQDGTLDINGAGANVAPYSGASSLNTLTIGALNGAGLITSSSATASAISLGASGTTVASPVFSGIIQDGAGTVTVIKNGTSASVQALTGLNTYTGGTVISGGSTLLANSLANGGVASSIGASTNAADKLVFNNGVLRYQGSNAAVYQTIQTPSVSIDRLFTLAGNGTIQSSGQYGNSVLAAGTANNASLIFSSTADIVYAGAATARTLTLGGTSIGDNEMRIRLIDNGVGALSFTKADAGLWILNPLTSNTYTGTTTISGGALRVASSAAAVQGLSANSPLVLNGGVLQTSGSFTRDLGAAVPGVGTTVAITGGASGFAAATTDRLVVTIGGGSLTWGSTNFNPSSLVLGASTALGEAEITNDIAIGAATRTVTVNNNGNTGTMVTAGILSGVISGAGAGGNSLIKNGGGVLILGNANTYTGSTRVDAGNLIVTSIGTGVSSSLGASGALIYNGPGNADLNALNYVGQGEIANRDLTFQGSNFTGNRVYRVDSSGTGALVWNTGTFINTTRGDTVARVITLELRGANTDDNQMNLVLADSTNATFANVLHVSKNDGGVWILNPTVANTFTGNININGGTLGLTANGIGSAGTISISNGALMAYGAPLEISNTISHANNAAVVFSGTNSITLKGGYSLVAGNNAMTFSNSLEGGATLTVNGTLTNLKANDQTLNIRGYGSTVWNGVIQNAAANLTVLNIAIANDASFTFGGSAANTYTGSTTLSQGTLILSKDSGVAQFGATSQFNFNGGVLTTDLSLTGVDKISTKVVLGGNMATINGSFNIDLGAATAVEYNGNRFLLNNLDSGKTLTISGAVAPTATAQTLTLRGSGTTLITGVVTNGGVTGAGNLAFSGLGSLEITTNSTAQGVLTVNRNLVTLSGADGSWNAGSFALNPTGILRLDNTTANNTAGRLSDTGAFAGNGGTLDIRGKAVDGSTHSGGPLNLNNVQTYITMSGGNVDLTFASVNFANPGSALNLAGISNLGTSNKVKFTAALPANAQIGSIMPRVYLGSDFATYDVTDGVKVFADYNPTSATDINAALAADTVLANSGMTTKTVSSAAKTINALKLNGSGITVDSTPGATTTLTLAAAAILNTGGTNTIGATGVNMGVNFAANAGHIQVASGTTLNLRAALLGTGGWAKAQTGELAILTPTFATGTVSFLNGSTKLISGGINTLFQAQTTFINEGATLDLNGSAQYIGLLNDPGVLPDTGGKITSTGGAALLVTNTTTAATVNTEITNTTGNAVSFAKLNTSTLTIGTSWDYTGSTTLMGGTLVLQDDATLIGTSAININGATLQLNNNGSLQTANYSRLGASIPISLRDGALTFTSLVNDASTESMGVLASIQGSNTVTVTNTAPSAIGSADVSFASLSRSAGTTINFAGSNLGQQGNNSRITFRDSSPTTILGGALGAWAIANSSDYAAYNSGVGVGIVGQGGFVGYDGTFASGNITEIPATAASTTTLSGATITGLLRIAGAFTNNIAFSSGTDTLTLEQGGILRSNNNNATTIGTSLIRGTITSGTDELVVYNNQGTTTINSVIHGATKLIKSGGGTLSLTANNTYTLGTSVVQGTLTLNGDVGTVVIPSGGLIIGGATVTMVGNAGQIDSSNVVIIRRSSTLTLVGNNTLDSLVFENNGGTTNPTVTVGGILTLTNSTPVSITTSNAQTLPVISGGTLALGSGAKIFNVEAPNIDGQIYTNTSPALNITSIITGTGPITKTGTGLLQLGGQSTFVGGISVTGGGLVLGASSTSTFANSLFSGPLGGGLVTMSAGTVLSVDDNSRAVGNAFTFLGNPIFSNVGATTDTLTINGALTFNTLATTGLVANVSTPYLNVVLGGEIQGIGSVTSVGSGSGANTITKSGLGSITGLNLTGLGAAVPISLTNLTSTTFSLLHDGDGTSSFETINLGTVSWEPATGSLNLTIGRAGSGLYFPTAAFKTVKLASLDSSFLPTGLILTNNNGYGLDVPDDIAFATVSANTGPTYNVSTLNTSLQVPGLTLSGKLTGGPSANGDRVLIKAGAGVLLLGNNGSNPTGTDSGDNSFGGTGAIIDITDGLLQVSSDAALGNAGNIVSISANNLAEGLRVSGTFATDREINLNGANSGIDVTRISATASNVFTLNTAFTYATATNGLAKNDLGTLVLTQAQTGWNGVMTINQGALRITNAAALGGGNSTAATDVTSTGATGQAVITPSSMAGLAVGQVVTGSGIPANTFITAMTATTVTLSATLTVANPTFTATTGHTMLANVGAALELSGGLGGLTVSEPLFFNTSDDVTNNGINGGGAVRSVSGANVLSGPILLNTVSGTNDRSRAATFTADSEASLDIQGVVTGNVGNGTGRDAWIGLGGAGTGTLSTAMAIDGFLGTNRFFGINKFGSGTWTITAANAHPGTRVFIKEGTLVLSGNGSLGTPTAGQETTPTIYLNPTGVLTLNNTSTDVDNRLGGRLLNVSGADVNIIGHAAGTTETVGAFTLREGLSVFTLDANALGQLDFTTGAITRSTGATLLIRGDNFGSNSGVGVATFTGNSYAYVGQTGAVDTATKGILPWALGDVSITGGGTGFVTSDTVANTGTTILRLLTSLEQTTDFATANANVNLGTTEVLSTLTTFNSLRLANNGGVDLNYVPLTLDSGGLIALAGNTGIDGFSGVSYLTTTSNREVIMHTVGGLILNVPIAATTGALTKSGAGQLTLTAGNAAHGSVFINEGILKLGGGDQTILPGRILQLNHGGTLDLNGTVQQFNYLESRLTAGLAQADLFSAESGGTVINSDSMNQATLVLGTSGVTFTGSIQGNIAVARSTAAAGFTDWNLYNEQTYSGPSLFNGGRTQFLVEGKLASTASILIDNATLLFSGSNATTDAQNITDRLGDTIPLTMRGGSFQFNTSAAYYTTETMGAISLAGGQNVISMSEGGTRVNQWDLTAASFSRVDGSRSTIRFYGIDSDPNDNARFFLNSLNGVNTTSIGAGLTNNLIGGWAVFEREFASYTPGQGVGALNTQGYAGYSPNLINDGVATDNIRFTNTGTTLLTGNRTINSLAMVVSGATALDLGGNTLTLVSGGVIASNATDNTAMTITNGSLTAGQFNVGGDLYLHTFGYVNGNTDTVNRDVNIDAIITNNGLGAVAVVINGDDGRGTGLDGLLNAESTNITGNNTYSGGTFVNAGRVILNNSTANGTSITATGTGDLTIAGGASTLGSTYQEFRSSVIYGNHDQIANTATVNLIGSGRLNLNGFNQTIANLVINNTGGHNPEVTTGLGTLTITGSSITASGQNASSNAISTIAGKIALGAATTTLTVNPVTWNSEVLNPILPNLLISASIEGGNIVKAGTGVLSLTGSNAYTGTFNLQAGGVQLGSNNAFSTGSLTIGNNTFLTSNNDARAVTNAYTVAGNFALRDAFNLTLSGAGTLTTGDHDISVELTQRILTLSGVLSGATANINKTGDGILVLGNSNNTYGGATTVTDGILRYGVANALPTGTALTVLEGGMLDITLGGTAVTVGSLAGDSAIKGGVIFHGATSGTNAFTVGGDNSTTSFGGVITNGTGSTLNLVKSGTGTMTLGGANQYNGSTIIENGRLMARPLAGGNSMGTGQSLVMGGGATSGILQLGDSSGALNQTFISLASAGTGTANQIVSGNASGSTLTLNLDTTSTFAGNIGGSGSNEANLNLVKSGAGDLSIKGSGTSMYNGATTVSGGKLFMDTVGAFSTATSSLTLADGTEFSLRGTTTDVVTSYGFDAGEGTKITVGTSAGATLGFGIDGLGNTQLVLASDQTMAVTGTLTTAIYVNSAPTGGHKYVLIDGADANSLTGFGGIFNTSPVVFNGGSFTYALSFDTLVDGGGIQQWVLTPTAQPALADVWWRGDLTGLAQGVWSATLTSGTGSPSNWDDLQDNTLAVDAQVPPDSASIVHFSSDASANLATTLGANMTIQALIFHTGNAATTIGSSNGINTLTLGNTSDPAGLTIQTGANDVGISAIVALPQDQSWNIEDSARVLTLSGGLTGTSRTLTVNDTTTNSGTLLFSGSAATMTGTLAIHAGKLVFEGTGSLNSGLDVVLGTASKAATLVVGGGSAASLATIGGLSNGAFAGSKVIGGNATLSTLAIGPATGTATFTGDLGGLGANENQFNLEKTGAGIQIINGAATYAGSTTVREGTLRLGTSAIFASTGALSVIANAGATAAFDFNGKSFTTVGTLTLGGGAGGIAQILDTNATKGVLTLGGNIVYDAANNPGSATISTNINTDGVNRVITAGNSTNSANELTISGTITAVTDNSLTFNGAGSGTIGGNISLNLASGTGASNDVTFASTGTWTINAKIEVDDDILINSGTVNANAVESLDALDDVVITGTGTQGSTVVNINVGSQVHTGDDIFIRGGAIVNLNTTNGINTGTDLLLIGDSGSASAAAAGVLNLAANMATTSGVQLGAAAGQIGNITGTGTFTSAGTKDLRNGSIDSGIILAGNGAITKQAIGTVTFSGERAAASTGASNIFEGTLILDYTTNNNSKLGGVLNLGQLANVSSPTLQINGNNGANTSQSVTSTTIAAGNTTVTINNGTGRTATLNLGAITRTTAGGAGVVSFEYLSGNAKATTTSAAGTLGWATLAIAAGQERFAAISAGDIIQAALTTQNNVALWSAGQNIINNGAFTGGLDCASIASLTFDGIGAANTLALTSTGHLAITSGGIMVDAAVGAFATSITGGNLIGAVNSGIAGEIIVHQNNTFGSLTIASKIINSGGITKTGLGTLILTGANTFLNTGSQLTINEGTVQIGGGNAIGDTTAVYLRQGTTLNLNNSNEVVGHLVSNSTGTIALGTGRITFNQTANTTYAGLFTGGNASVITLNGPLFNFNITGSTTTGFTGGVVVNSGLLQISGASGRLGGALSFTITKSGTLLIDNNDDSAPNDRISDSAAFTLHSADGTPSGEVTRPRGLWIRSDNSGNEDETIGALTFASGASYATLDANTTNAAAVLRLISSGWTRNAGATINVRGRSLGVTTGQRTGFKIADANDAAFMTANLVGGAGAAGTDTRSIVPWAMGENMTVGAAADTNMGNTLLTYVDDVGFVPLNFTNEYSTFSAKDSNSDNIRESLTASLTGLAGQTINSLVIHNNSTAASTINVTGTGAGTALVNTSGAFLFTLNTAATASTAHSVILGDFNDGVQVGPSNEYVFFVVNPSSAPTTPTLTARIDSPLNSTGASVTKSGRGTLEFTAVNTYTGGTTVNEGTLLIHDNDNIGGTGTGTQGDITLAGGTLALASDYADDLGSRDLLVSEGGGTIQVDATSVTATNLITTGTGILAKTGTGTLQLAGANANTHSGVVTVNQGTLELNKTAGVNAISGSALTIGGTGQNATVRLLAANQIANTTAVSITSTGATAMGVFDLNNQAETIGALTMTGSTVQGVLLSTGASGVLTVGGDIILNSNRAVNDSLTNARNIVITGTGTIGTAGANTGTLNLGGVTRTITVQTTATGTNLGNADATIETTITNGGIIKEGSRALILSGANTYTGGTTINNGEINLQGSLAAGAVIINKVGGSLGDAAVLSGTGTIAGAVIVGEADCGVGILALGALANTTTLVANYGAGANGTMTITAVGAALTVANGSQIQLGITNETFNSAGVSLALATASYTDALTYIGANEAEFTSNWNVAPAVTTDMDFVNLTNGFITLGTRSGGAGTGTIAVTDFGYASTAAKGDVFNLIDWQGVMGGTFSAGTGFSSGGILGDFDLPTLGVGLAWDASAFSTYGILVVVPEPSRALLLLLGLLGLVTRRRRSAC